MENATDTVKASGRLHFGYTMCYMVEHAAVNRRVVGSSPTGGARNCPVNEIWPDNLFLHENQHHIWVHIAAANSGEPHCWPELFLKAPKSKGQVRPFEQTLCAILRSDTVERIVINHCRHDRPLERREKSRAPRPREAYSEKPKHDMHSARRKENFPAGAAFSELNFTHRSAALQKRWDQGRQHETRAQNPAESTPI